MQRYNLVVSWKFAKSHDFVFSVACGYHGLLNVQHKLNTFILKNPPNINPASQGASLTEKKRSKRSNKKDDGDTNGDTTVDSNELETSKLSVRFGFPLHKTNFRSSVCAC
jgi:hypothetical protein